MITIVDYGMGNLRSVQKGFERVGSEAEITSEPERVSHAEKLVLPGVGAFKDAMANLRSHSLIEPLQAFLQGNRPFLGICLGLQMLFEKGYEDGEHDGLGLFPGTVVRFDLPNGYKVPHMGWNQLQVDRCAPLLSGLPPDVNVYFVHSYYVAPEQEEIVATRTDYGGWFTSMIWRDNIFASQFHPEKSQKVGLHILRKFVEL